MTPLVPLQFDEFDIRITDQHGDPWFVLADVCRVLGLKNPGQIATRLDDDEKGIILNDTLRGAQPMIIISEPALNWVVMRSDAAADKRTTAYRFRRWITHEVLPAIRKYGFYDPARVERIRAAEVEESKTQPTVRHRMALEIARFEERTGMAATAIPELTRNRLVHLREAANSYRSLTKNDLWFWLLASGFDLHYIFWGEHAHRILDRPDYRLEARDAQALLSPDE